MADQAEDDAGQELVSMEDGGTLSPPLWDDELLDDVPQYGGSRTERRQLLKPCLILVVAVVSVCLLLAILLFAAHHFDHSDSILGMFYCCF